MKNLRLRFLSDNLAEPTAYGSIQPKKESREEGLFQCARNQRTRPLPTDAASEGHGVSDLCTPLQIAALTNSCSVAIQVCSNTTRRNPCLTPQATVVLLQKKR